MVQYPCQTVRRHKSGTKDILIAISTVVFVSFYCYDFFEECIQNLGYGCTKQRDTHCYETGEGLYIIY